MILINFILINLIRPIRVRSILSILLTTLNSLISAQSTDTQRDPLDVFKASPSAQSLERYGGLNVGLASGTVNKQILLYDFRGKHINVPISVNYSSNGVKVDDNGGIVGTSWTASLGGVITRTVMGEQDERTTRLSANFNPYGGDAQTLSYLKGMMTYNTTASAYDGEPDVYSFNFAGHSGKFIFDVNDKPVLLNHSGLHIERMGLTAFLIVTPDGTRYEFGGTGAIETSYKSGEGCGKVFAQPHNSAFFLKKITHVTGESVNFLYNGTINYMYNTGMQETMSSSKVIQCAEGEPPRSVRTACFSSIITTTPMLQEINSNLGKIVFSYKSHLAGGDRLLTGMKVYRTNESTAFREIKLNYYSHLATRNYGQHDLLSTKEQLKHWNFLSAIEERNSQGLIERKFGFSYLNLNLLPVRFSNCQDYYGYFNGRYNSSLVPPPENEDLQSSFPAATADRTPNSSVVSTGMLCRIDYPTGGSDSLVYESNEVWGSTIIPAPDIYGGLTVKGVAPLQEGTGMTEPFTVTESSTMNITLRCNILGEDPYPGTGTAELLANGVKVLSLVAQAYQTNTDTYTLQPNTSYQFRVKAAKGPMVESALSFIYPGGAPTTRYENKIAPGVRIAKVITKTGTSQYLKEFKYHAISDLTKKSTASFMFTPVFEWHNTSQFKCVLDDPPSDCAMSGLTSTVTLSSNSRFGSAYYASAPVYYSEVYEEDNATNGGIIYKYNLFPNARPNLLRGEDMNGPLTSNDDQNGLETFRRYYKRKGTSIIPVKDVYTTFKIDSRVSRIHKAYFAHERHIVTCTSSGTPLPMEFDAFNLLEYHHHQRWIYVDSIKTRDYAVDGTKYNESIELFYYDNTDHAQLSRKVRLSSDNSSTVSQSLYASDYAAGTPFINDMKTKRILSSPIETVNYKQRGTDIQITGGEVSLYKIGGKGLVESTKRIQSENPITLSGFKFSNRNVGILPPTGSPTAFSIDNRYADYLKINLYDQYDNPREAKRQSGPVVTYLWGYGGQYPVAKIENATYAQVLAVLSQTKIDGLNAANVSDATIQSTLNILRNDARMKQAQVSSYTYKPLTGMTSMTDPRGITEYYEYDGFQRLKEVLDFDRNVLKDIRYHYKP